MALCADRGGKAKIGWPDVCTQLHVVLYATKSSSFPYVHLKCVTNIMHKNSIFQSSGGPITQIILISPKGKWEFKSRRRAHILSAFRPWMQAVRWSVIEWRSCTGQDPASIYSGTAVLDRDLWGPLLWPFLILLERVTFRSWGWSWSSFTTEMKHRQDLTTFFPVVTQHVLVQ